MHTAHTVGGEDGSASHHIVHFAGGGFAVLSADDTSAPIVAFSDSGDEFVQDERNPLWSILQRDRAGRKAARSRRKRHPGWSEGGRHGEPRVSTNVKLSASALAEGWLAVLKGSSDLQIWHDAETARDRFFKLVVEQFISVD